MMALSNLLHGGDRKSDNFKASFEALKGIASNEAINKEGEAAASSFHEPTKTNASDEAFVSAGSNQHVRTEEASKEASSLKVGASSEVPTLDETALKRPHQK
jgi:hypothetical protein